jgi:hypothetical protein
MSLDDLTIFEQEEYSAWADATAQQEFEQRKWTVECELCDRNEIATQQDLERRGWLLDRSGEFCPTHNWMRLFGNCGPQVQQLAGAH